MTPQLHDGDTFTHRGYSFRVNLVPDSDHGNPWDEEGGHGPVSDWRSSDDGREGERILATDNSGYHALFYDIAEATRIAERDGWGCPCAASHEAGIDNALSPSGHPLTRAAEIAHAVEADYARLRAWCDDNWYYLGVVVTLLDEEGHPTTETESLWGIESDSDDYLVEVAHELAAEILARVEVESPLATLSEN